jgi:DNA repair protein SbcD/Mre11
MPIKILATGDLHIGIKASLPSVIAEEFSARDTWKRIVNWSIANQVDAVALTGDIVDRYNRYYEAIGPLQSGFAKLKEKEIEVFIVSGNHDFDVLPQIISSGKLDNVHLLGAGGTWELRRFTKKKEIVQFVGWSFPSQYVRQDPLMQFALMNIDPDIPCIGLLHTEVDTPLSKYAPAGLANFMNLPVDAWILGHIHKPEVLNPDSPYICYPGSPLALSSKETGIHSPLLVTISNKSVLEPETILASPVRFETIQIDITGSENEDDLHSRIFTGISSNAEAFDHEQNGTSCIVFDLKLTGTHADTGRIEAWTRSLPGDFTHETTGNTRAFVREVKYDITPEITNMADLARQDTSAGILARTIIAVRKNNDNDFLRKLYVDWKENFNRINGNDTYQPLNKVRVNEDAIKETFRQYVLKESGRLLGELLKQNGE